MNPCVSVVVPVYNLEFYIARCVDSILAQDFDAPFEIVAVDDGSTDDTPVLLREYAEAHPRVVRRFTKPNGGHGAACNFGIGQARGDFVMFVDGDDFLEPDVLREMHAKALETDADLLLGNLRYHFEDRVEQHRPLPHVDGERAVAGDDWDALFHNWPTPCGRLYRRSLFDDPEVRFPEGRIHDDAGFAPKTYLAARKIYYANRIWYEYDLTRPDQSMKATTRRILDIVPVLTDALEFYRRRGAFERCRAQLEEYTVAHVLTWMMRAGRLCDYPVDRALRELCAVPDRYFPGWMDRGAFARQRPHPRQRLMMKMGRATGYRTYLVKRAVKRGIARFFDVSRDLAELPAAGVERLRDRTERFVGNLKDPF